MSAWVPIGLGFRYGLLLAMNDVAEDPADDSEYADRLPARGEILADKYEVEEVIGRGGMGTVVAARHVRLGKLVAIKLLHRDLVHDDITVARFLREAQATVDLRSEHAAQVSDVGVLDDGTPYMIMEYLRGRDLEAVLEEKGPLPQADALDYVLQATVAVAEAHRNGLVHRDLKPGNLFLTRAVDDAPLVKVLDFGITKKVQDDASAEQRLTTTGMAVGTPLFMSPEQLRDTSNVDHRSDIWALGAVLQELLTGEPPFVADTIAALAAMIAADEPASLTDQRPDLPPELEQAIFRCLEKRPEDRYQDVGAFARAMAPFAPLRSLGLVARIERIVGPRTAPEDTSVSWRDDDDLAATMDSPPLEEEAEELASEPPPEPSPDGEISLSSLTAVQQPASSGGEWPADRKGASIVPIGVLGGAVVAVLIAILLWAPWSSSPRGAVDRESTSAPPASAVSAESTHAAATIEPVIAASARGPADAEPRGTASAAPSVASASASGSVSARPNRPPRPPALIPPRPAPSYNLLDERK